MDTASALWEIEQIKQLKARYWRLMDTKRWVDARLTRLRVDSLPPAAPAPPSGEARP